MKKLGLILLAGVLVAITACSQSDSDSVVETAAVVDTSYTGALKATMKIVKNLNHHPSSAEKTALTTYMGAMDGSANSAALAQVMAVVKATEHFPSDSDKVKLEELAGDLGANGGDPDLITLIEIIGRVAHKVSAEDKAKLEAMIAK